MIELADTTIIIPFKPQQDSTERVDNLVLVLDYLTSITDCKIILVTQGSLEIPNYPQVQILNCPSSTKYVEKSKKLNFGVKNTNSKYVIQHDADLLLQPSVYKKIHQSFRQGVDFFYPYSGRVVNINTPSKQMTNIVRQERNCPVGSYTLLHQFNPKGGIFCWNKQFYYKIGMFNEKFVGYGYQDWQIYQRIVKLGYTVPRFKKVLYHLNHQRTKLNSGGDKKSWLVNKSIYDRTMNLSKQQLIQEIKSWHWVYQN